jgi:hypothetical protein
MENNKVVFLCLILLLVLVVSNYVSIVEGFKAKKGPDISKSPRQIAREEADKVKKKVEKIANSAMTEAKKALAAAQTASSQKSQQSQTSTQDLQQMQTLTKNMETLAKTMETLAKNTEDKIKTSDALSKQVLEKAAALDANTKQVLEKAAGLDANAKQISNSTAKIDTEIARISNLANSTEKNANGILTQVSGKAASVDKSVEANKVIQNEINRKVGGIDKQLEISKNNTDAVLQIKIEIDRIMNEFKVNSETMLKTMQLAIDNMNAKKQGFQNMNDPVLQASESLKKDMESAKLLAFTTIDSAYNGDLHLETPWNSAGTVGTVGTVGIAGTVGTPSMEGFANSTTAHSAYVNPSDISKLEKDVLTAFSDFNTKYYDVYQKCLHDRRKTQDRIKNGEKGLVMPQCGKTLTGSSGFLQDVINAKNVLIGKIELLNSAIVAMGKKPESTVATNGTYVISGKKITEQQFMERHNQIKALHAKITEMRLDLDMKMANLLDKTKGPLPEAQNKYNFENYATIGWSVLATSILYYTFVEMK